MKTIITGICAATLLACGTAWAGSVADADLTPAVAGAKAVAADYNANLDTLQDAINDNDAGVTTNAAAINANGTDIGANAVGIAANGTAITTNAANIGTNGTAIGANQTAIGANAVDIAGNATAISAKQNRVTGTCAAGEKMLAVNGDGSVNCGTDANAGGDITGVTAGTHLNGGGTTGTVSLSVSDMPGIEFIGSDSSTVLAPNVATAVVAVTLTAPATGYVLATFTGECLVPAGTVHIVVDTSSATDPAVNTVGKIRCATGSSVFSVQRVFFVAAGSTTYFARARLLGSALPGNVNYPFLTLQYFPIRY